MEAHINTLLTYFSKKLRIDAHHYIYGGFWLSLTQAIVIACGILTTALFAHYLSEANYGIYRYLVSLSVVLSALSLTGLGQTILQASSKKYLSFYQESFKINFLYNTGITCAGVICSAYYALHGNKILSLGCVLIALLQPLINTYQYAPTYLQAQRQFRKATITQGLKTVFISVTSIASLFFSQSIFILFLTYLLAQAIANYMAHMIFKPRAQEPTPKEIYEKYISYAKHSSVRNVISLVSLRLDSIIIFTQLGGAQLAIYSIATVVPEQIKAALKNLAILLVQKYSNHNDMNLLLKSVPKRSLQLFFILLLLTVVYMASAPYLYHLLFPKYPEAVFYSQLYSLAFLTHILYIPNSILQVRMEEKKLYYLSTAGAVFLIVLLLVLIPHYGIVGAVMSTLLYRIVFTTLTFLSLPRN